MNPKMMRKLPEVEDAKELMGEAMEWSVFRWLFEKQRVRETADQANAALDKLDRAVKARWSSEIRTAYNELLEQTDGSRRRKPGKQPSPAIDPKVQLFAKTIKEADDKAYRARMDAEETFDEAERQLNTSLAREGCRKAIDSWNLHEKAIRKAEADVGSN